MCITSGWGLHQINNSLGINELGHALAGFPQKMNSLGIVNLGSRKKFKTKSEKKFKQTEL